MLNKAREFRKLSWALWSMRENTFLPNSKIAEKVNALVPGVKIPKEKEPALKRLIVLVASTRHLGITLCQLELEEARLVNPMYIRVRQELHDQSRELLKLELSLFRKYRYE